MNTRETLLALREQLALLPAISIRFGNGHECCPPSVIREKVLSVLDSYISEQRDTAELGRI